MRRPDGVLGTGHQVTGADADPVGVLDGAGDLGGAVDEQTPAAGHAFVVLTPVQLSRQVHVDRRIVGAAVIVHHPFPDVDGAEYHRSTVSGSNTRFANGLSSDGETELGVQQVHPRLRVGAVQIFDHLRGTLAGTEHRERPVMRRRYPADPVRMS